MSAIALSRPIHYPESDGRPLAETQAHGQVMLDLVFTLKRRYANVPDVYVWGNMLFYYVEGDPRACVAPDLFLVKGVDKRVRRTYKLWEEGQAPSLIIEVTSKSTRAEDTKLKRGVYERLGVTEYFLFDPFGESCGPGSRATLGPPRLVAVEPPGDLGRLLAIHGDQREALGRRLFL